MLVENNVTCRRAEAFVHELVRRFWAGDEDFIASALEDDFVWIAAQEDQYLLGRDATLETYRRLISSIPSVVFPEPGAATIWILPSARYFSALASTRS